MKISYLSGLLFLITSSMWKCALRASTLTLSTVSSHTNSKWWPRRQSRSFGSLETRLKRPETDDDHKMTLYSSDSPLSWSCSCYFLRFRYIFHTLHSFHWCVIISLHTCLGFEFTRCRAARKKKTSRGRFSVQKCRLRICFRCKLSLLHFFAWIECVTFLKSLIHLYLFVVIGIFTSIHVWTWTLTKKQPHIIHEHT